MPRLLSINVGLPRDISWQGKVVRTAVWKTPVQGRRMVRRLNIDGDGQGDLTGHGGEHRAVLVYQIESYRHWQNHLGRAGFEYGQFGENFTVEGLPDAEVRIGNRYRIGGTLLEVTQPRVTCYRVGIRMNEPAMAALLVSHARPGFYCRVLEEGYAEAGDGITQVASGPEGMKVTETNALLYMPGHPRDELERALRIPALSDGWRKSFEALLTQERKEGGAAGNAGLTAASGPLPAWQGFRPFRVSRKGRQSGSVVSLTLEPADGKPVPPALPGQFVVLRLEASTAPALLRSYSLSGAPGAAAYRISVKRKAHGAAGAYIDDQLRDGDIVNASAARGNFTLRSGTAPVVLVGAGIGLTPLLAMLHALAAEGSLRDIWWLYGTRNGREHPFAGEVLELLTMLAHSHKHIRYSAPEPEDRLGIDFDAPGRLNPRVLDELHLPHDGDFYICGPSAFMHDMTTGLVGLSIGQDRIHTETFGTRPSITPGIAASPYGPPHLPPRAQGAGPLVSFARSGISLRWAPTYQSLLELAEACDVPARWSCRSGVCHTCESGLIEGTIDYRPEPIDAPAGGNVLICCSRPRTDLVIDL